MLIALMILAAVVAPAKSPATTSKAPTTQQLKLEERLSIGADIVPLPTAGPHKLSEVVTLRLEDKRIEATTAVQHGHDFLRVLLESEDGLSTMQFGASARRGAAPADRRKAAVPPNARLESQFFFRRYNFKDPSRIYVLSEVSTHPGYCLISVTWHGMGRDSVVQILDQGPGIDEAGQPTAPELAVYVQSFIGDDDDAETAIDLKLKTRDLPTLLREHPLEVNAYVRPALRELEAQSLLAPDPAVAWQVFGASKKPEARIVENVNNLVAGLDAASFAERQAAGKALKDLGSPGAIVLLQLDRSKLSAEQTAQLEDILAQYQQISAEEAKALAGNIPFLLDCLELPDVEIRQLAAKRLSEKLGSGADFDPTASDAARETALSKLRTRLLPPPSTQSAK